MERVTLGLMHVASDYIYPYKGAGSRPARYRVRIYLPDVSRKASVVTCSELPKNSGGSITPWQEPVGRQ